MDERNIPCSLNHLFIVKFLADFIALCLFFYSFNSPVSIIRPFNAYGPRQFISRIIPTIINQDENNKDNQIFELKKFKPN